jgi:hypothetical protein
MYSGLPYYWDGGEPHQHQRSKVVKLSHILFLMLAICSVSAFSQPANPFLGKWKVTWEGAKQIYQATLIIDGTGGTWRTLTHSKFDSCAGKEVPIAVQSSSADAMTIKLKFSEVLQGCNDGTVKLTRVDDKTITGKRGNLDLVLSRE